MSSSIAWLRKTDLSKPPSQFSPSQLFADITESAFFKGFLGVNGHPNSILGEITLRRQLGPYVPLPELPRAGGFF
jgi:hypothetical protein